MGPPPDLRLLSKNIFTKAVDVVLRSPEICNQLFSVVSLDSGSNSLIRCPLYSMLANFTARAASVVILKMLKYKIVVETSKFR